MDFETHIRLQIFVSLVLELPGEPLAYEYHVREALSNTWLKGSPRFYLDYLNESRQHFSYSG